MGNDLISRSALMDRLKGNVLIDVTTELEKAIQEQPTAYDVDKVVELLEKEMGKHNDTMQVCLDNQTGDICIYTYLNIEETAANSFNKSIEIVKAGEVNV